MVISTIVHSFHYETELVNALFILLEKKYSLQFVLQIFWLCGLLEKRWYNFVIFESIMAFQRKFLEYANSELQENVASKMLLLAPFRRNFQAFGKIEI